MTESEPLQEIQERGFCVLRGRFAERIAACREAFWPVLADYLERHGDAPNRGPHRHFLPMPFEPPCFTPEFFFDPKILRIVQGLMGERVVADQWGCDVPVAGSEYQAAHVDYRRPLFEESPEMQLPVYMLVVSFGLVRITAENGAIEIAPGTHRVNRKEASEVGMESVPLEIGDVLIRHPWVWHRGTPNRTAIPRPLATIRYVRRWYWDDSREVNPIGPAMWGSLTTEQQHMMRFPLGGRFV